MNDLVKKIQKVDNGKEFGLKDSPEFKEAFLSHRQDNINPALDHIIRKESSKKSFRIGDFGGGNAILGKYFVDILKERNTNFVFDNIDIDPSKLIKYDGISNIDADIRNYFPKECYDVILARHLIHYLNSEEKKKTIKNIYDAAKKDSIFVLTQPVALDKRQQLFLNELYSSLSKLKDCNKKYWDTKKELIGYLKEVGFKDVEVYTNYDVFYTLNNFYKPRYKLDDNQIDIVKNKLKEGMDISGIEKRTDYGTLMPSLVIVAKKGRK